MTESSTFQSLHVRNYRLLYFGQAVSQCGTWMQTIALSWLVLDLSHQSGVAVGFAVALQYLPTLLLVVYAGTLADRLDKRKLLVATDSTMAIFATLLLVLDLTGVVQLWMIYVVVFAYGIAFALDSPTRQAFVPELVPAADLPNAIGLNSASTQLARVLGPAVGGLVVVTVGTSACFGLNALSYLCVIVTYLLMRPSELHRGTRVTREPRQIRDGLQYMWRTKELRVTLLVLVVVGTFAINSPVILPLMARTVFGGDAEVFSWMTIGMGTGALVGALVWARRPRPRGDVLLLAGLGYGAAIVVACSRAGVGGVPDAPARGRCDADVVPLRGELARPAHLGPEHARTGDGRVHPGGGRHDTDRRSDHRLAEQPVRRAMGLRVRRCRCDGRGARVRAHHARAWAATAAMGPPCSASTTR